MPSQWIKSKLSNFLVANQLNEAENAFASQSKEAAEKKKHVATRFPLIHYDKLQQISVCVCVWAERLFRLNGAFEKWLEKKPNFNRQPNLRLAFPALFFFTPHPAAAAAANENCFRWFLLDFRMYLIWNS